MSRRILRTGYVAARYAESVRINFRSAGACTNCKAGLGCGIGPIVGLFQSPPSICLGLDRPGVGDLRAGDAVSLGIAPAQLLMHVGLVYLLPLLGLFAGAASAYFALGGADDLQAAAGSGAGFFLAYVFARGLRKLLDLDTGLEPQLVSLPQ